MTWVVDKIFEHDVRCAQPSITLVAAGAFGFLTLIQLQKFFEPVSPA